MRTRSPSPDRPQEDRLERLLRSGGDADVDVDPDADGDEGADRTVGAEETAEDWVDLVEDVAGGSPVDDEASDRIVRGRHRVGQVPLMSVPASLRSSELRVGVQPVRGLLVLVVVAALVLGGRWLWTTQRAAVASPADRIVTTDTSGATAAGVPALEPQSTEAAPSQGDADAMPVPAVDPQQADLVVHVAGEVSAPGVVEVPAGSRVVDAVRAAGGVTEQADPSTLNLARLLVDGERVWVGRPGETPPVAPGPVGEAGARPGGGAEPQGPAARLDLNAATQADLEELPGIGPVTAGHILTWREEHGRFSSVEELLEVSGIGERTLAQLEPLVTVGG